MNFDLKKVIYLFLIFLLGCLAGYLYEIIFYYFTLDKILNPGVLYGPWLPIYGIGAICLYFLKPIKKHPILLFILSMIITGIVEYVIGYISINLFDTKLWDYTGLFLNISGIVCLRSVISFAILGMFFHYLIEPFMEKMYNKISFKSIKVFSGIILVIFIIDIIISYLFRTPPKTF